MVVRVSKPAFNLRERLTELDIPVGAHGGQLLRSETGEETFKLVSGGRRRLNINGAMLMAQRVEGGYQGGTDLERTGLANGYHYICDRYHTQQSDMGTWTISQDTDVPNGINHSEFQKCLKGQCTGTGTLGGNANLQILHRLEGWDSQVVRYGTEDPQHVTLSFWLKMNRAGGFQVNFEQEHTKDGSGTDRGYQVPLEYDKPDVWQKFVVTIPGDPYGGFQYNSAKAFCFDISLSKGAGIYDGTGTTATAEWSTLDNDQRTTHCTNYMGDSTNNYYKLTGVQLELGTVATPFEHWTRGEEQQRCYRYFRRFSDNQGGDSYTGYGTMLFNSNVSGLWTFPIDIHMRAKPTISGYNVRIYDASHNEPVSAFNTNRSSQSTIWIEPAVSSAGFTLGRAGIIGNNNQSNGYVDLHAEI